MGYTGFFVRDQLGQQPDQQGGGFDGSPDIVLMQQQVPSVQLATPAAYGTDYGSSVSAGAPTFVYPRALASQIANTTGQAWFFWTIEPLLLWPQEWRSDQVAVGGQAINYQPISAGEEDQPCIVSTPFEWTPQPEASGSTDYYAILWIDGSGNGGNPLNLLQPFTGIDEIQAFVTQTPNVGMRRCSLTGGFDAAITEPLVERSGCLPFGKLLRPGTLR